MNNESYEVYWERLKQNPALLQAEVAAAVSLDPTHLVSAMYEQASTLMTWAYLASLAAAEADAAKFQLEEVVLPRLRAQARAEAGSKKLTVQEAQDFASLHPDHIEAAAECRAAQALADTIRKVEFALGHRRDMIQTINSRQRIELRNQE